MKQRTFIVFGHRSADLVKEGDLEKVLCFCSGKVKIIEEQHDDYCGRQHYLLQCQKCKGKYTATENVRFGIGKQS